MGAVAKRTPRVSRRAEIPKFTPEYVAALGRTADELAADSLSPNTRRAYTSAWASFCEWCMGAGKAPLPAEEPLLVAYVAHLENLCVTHSTVVRHISAIRRFHTLHKKPLRTGAALADVMRGHARKHGRAAEHQATGMRLNHLRAIVRPLDPTDIRDVRDRAIILLGFAGGFRRSELAALTVADVADHQDGIHITVRRSKADQEGRGMAKAVPFGSRPDTCPVLAYQAWIGMSGVGSGRVFRAIRKNGAVWGDGITDRVIAEVVKARAKAAGINGTWSGHSLRRGFATEAAARGVPRHQIMKDGGWTSSAVDAYIEAGSSFKDRAASRLGL